MLGRRRISDTAAPIRSSLANAAFAVEERVVWGGVGVLRRAFDAGKWPFERAAWAVERGLVWPLQERSGEWGAPVRIFGVAALALLAVAAGTLGLKLAEGGGGRGAPAAHEVAAPVRVPVAPQAVKPEPAAPALHGTKPDFAAEADAGTAGSPAEAGASSSSTATANSTSEVATSGTTSSAAAASESAGPAAIEVAHQFAGAFLIFETGRNTGKVRTVFNETATPHLAHSLLRRPPRLPAGVKVPKAKVLNVVPGPHHGDTYTLSVSLLRVGITSELRLNVQRDEKSGEWLVTEVLG